jgi:hypothetical protein
MVLLEELGKLKRKPTTFPLVVKRLKYVLYKWLKLSFEVFTAATEKYHLLGYCAVWLL